MVGISSLVFFFAQAAKNKSKQWDLDYIKLKSFCTTKRKKKTTTTTKTINRVSRQPT